MWLLSYILLGVLAYYSALFLIGGLAANEDDCEEFIAQVLMTIYNGIGVVFLSWIFFGTASTLLVAYATGLFAVIARIDLEATHTALHEDQD